MIPGCNKFFGAEFGSSKMFRNFVKFLPDYTASQIGRMNMNSTHQLMHHHIDFYILNKF